MFDSLSDRFETIFRRLRGRGRMGEAEVDEVLREIRVALLEADVNFKVVKGLIGRIKADCLEADLSASLTPAQQVIKIVHQELITSLGGETLKITYASRPPTVVMLAGLQGSGKTTAAGKLGRWFKQQGRNPILVGADLQRPAAVEQLRVLGGQAGVPVWSEPSDPVAVAKGAIEEARRLGRDVLIVDTAGRLHVDDDLMDEARQMSEALTPDYARGGAALSVKEVIGKPIAFASVGEKLADFEPFHPDRMASRILGMGDMLTLIEKAEQAYDRDEADVAAAKLQSGSFNLEDFLDQMQQVKKMGPLQNIVGMLPGIPKELRKAEIDDREIARVEAIIKSMTLEERRTPEIMNGSRRLRVANGSGVTTSEVNQLLKQFKDMQKMMKMMGRAAKGGKGRAPSLGLPGM